MKFSWKSACVVIAISVITAIFSYFILPEQVAVQIRLDGSTNRTLSRTVAVLVPVALCVLGSLSYLESNETLPKKIGSLLVVLLGLILPVFIWFINYFLS